VWQVLALSDEPELFAGLEPDDPPPALPLLSKREVVLADYDTQGLSLNAHPMSLVREDLTPLKVRPCRDLRESRQGQWMRTAGVVLVRQRPGTAKGIIFATIEDETGAANLIIRPDIYEKYRRAASGAPAIIAEGRIERQGLVVHLQVTRIRDLSGGLAELRSLSRDFQ
jgi:error-prone DNA polymerase